jgi:ribosome-binding protein aMBF1 (putative translation factor)
VTKKELASLKPIPTEQSILDSLATAQLVIESRKALGLSQKCLAMEMKIHPAYLCDLEGGNRKWNESLFERAKQAMQRLAKFKA